MLTWEDISPFLPIQWILIASALGFPPKIHGSQTAGSPLLESMLENKLNHWNHWHFISGQKCLVSIFLLQGFLLINLSPHIMTAGQYFCFVFWCFDFPPLLNVLFSLGAGPQWGGGYSGRSIRDRSNGRTHQHMERPLFFLVRIIFLRRHCMCFIHSSFSLSPVCWTSYWGSKWTLGHAPHCGLSGTFVVFSQVPMLNFKNLLFVDRVWNISANITHFLYCFCCIVSKYQALCGTSMLQM